MLAASLSAGRFRVGQDRVGRERGVWAQPCDPDRAAGACASALADGSVLEIAGIF